MNYEGSLKIFAAAGYIVVSQDARGKGESEGKYESTYRFKTHDAEDGYDSVEWAAKLPGSTGKVGTLGVSADASLQWRLAPLRPPSLVAMAACSTSPKLPYWEKPCTIRPAFRLEWLAMMALDMRRLANLPGVHTSWEHALLWKEEENKWLYWLPWLDLPDDFFAYETETIKSWLRNPYTDPLKLQEGCKEVTVPNLDIVGWYDHAHGDMLYFRTMVKEAKTRTAREGSRLIIGPWGHGAFFRRVGDFDFGPNATMDTTALRIRWFDYWLKGIQNGVDEDPPVRIFVMGDNQWRNETHWPLQQSQSRILYLTSHGRANTPSGDGKLVDEKPKSASSDSYIYDPNNPVPTPFGAKRPVAADQRPLAGREDILVYHTEPLAERVEVTGNPIVELFAASSAPDTDWFVRLIDVSPDGPSRDASSGLVWARYRDGFEKPRLIKPGEIVKYTIRMSPTSNAFLPGHRIRLDITSSDFPSHDRNHNTAVNQNADATLVPAKQIVFNGGERATRIILPWAPNTKSQGQRQVEPGEFNESLLEAARSGNAVEVRSALSKGADINAKDVWGSTALHNAIRADHREIVDLLLASGADVNIKGPFNRTPAELAWRDHEDLFKLLLSKGAEIPPLHVAALLGQLPTIERLVQGGAELNRRTPFGATALYLAALKGHKDVAAFLIDRGAQVNINDNWSWTPLHSAASFGFPEVVKLLVAKGANVNAEDGDRCTPLHYALLEGRKNIAGYLVEHGAEIDKNGRESAELFRAVRVIDEGKVRNILSASIIKIDVKESGSGLTLLHLAAARGLETVTELLLSQGAKIDQKDDEYAFTALHYAARFGNKKLAELLLARGADINARDKWGEQPMHIAAYHDRADLVKLLISRGADINPTTSSGKTPLQLAESRRNKATIELLCRHGAEK